VSRILIAGGAGFIGSTYARVALEARPDDQVVIFDKLTYAGRTENLEDVWSRIEFVEGAIEDRTAVREAIDGADLVVNFAAESHVDRSIADQDAFAVTQVIGTGVLLDAVRDAGAARFLQVSTDEVYGSITEGTFTEESPIAPSSPYSATKAGGDLLVQAHVHTHAIEAVICRGSNNYGPRQYPEKLIPLMILNALHNDPLPVYGDGKNVRNWIHAEDFARAIDTVLLSGNPGEVYNAGGPDELENLDVVHRILELTGADDSLIRYVTDRKGHDRRYSLSSQKVRALGWEPRWRFDDGLPATVQWYRDNEWWWGPIRSGEYRQYYERQYGVKLG
jgi:dTDP-glucose 4,6-dehydratase